MKKKIPYKLLFLLTPIVLLFLNFLVVALYGAIMSFVNNFVNAEIVVYFVIAFISGTICVNAIRIAISTHISLQDNTLVVSNMNSQNSNFLSLGYHYSLKKVVANYDLNTITQFGYSNTASSNMTSFRTNVRAPIYLKDKTGNKIIIETAPYTKKQMETLVKEIEQITGKKCKNLN